MTKSQWLSLKPGNVIKSKTSGCTEVVLKANLPTFRLRNRGGNALNRKMWTLVKRKAVRKKQYVFALRTYIDGRRRLTSSLNQHEARCFLIAAKTLASYLRQNL